MSELVKKYDNWLKDDSDVAALVMRQWLVPLEGEDAVIFPPTYTLAETDIGNRFNKGEPIRGVYKGQNGPMGYNIDWFEDGTSVCQIDSVGSQANRMEPIFMREPYKELVPEVIIKAGDKEVNLLEAGHRAADAIVRFSDLREELEEAFKQVRAGDATKLARIAPTSLVFGVWDSRGTQVKFPRVVRSVIRAFKVKPLHRSAQYIPAIDYVGIGLLDAPGEKKQQDAMSELGLSHAPAPWSHGGILVEGEIRRDAALNLVALRALRAGRDADPLPLRRYILGLSLVAFTAPQETFLREGCQLVPDPDRPSTWSLVKHDGSREENFEVAHKQALEYAKVVAKEFGVGPKKEANFNEKKARDELDRSKQERKKTRRAKLSEADANQ
ncbi:type I-G CRISPR-associated RAMP protein Csb1/Cas7g [Limisphaera sp. 4302-co]|uniref:type I-G CRISPR-associated RAMP protein Csb1/Cas7g n=1 Tax=Limisphaera sp. 4302-co TaxID=3400417 RepID=UPI003C1B46B2